MSIYVDIEKKLGNFQLKMKLETQDDTLALLGASGSGKSMTLKCIAGVETPDRGRIVVNDTVFFDSGKNINLPPQQRRTGLMFQNYALFPNMTVMENIRAGAAREQNKQKRERAVRTIMDSFGLTELKDLRPKQLSGGQQQRTALARMLVSEPQILLLDEPFSALDSHLRYRLEQEVRQVIRQFGKTVLLVSHDRDEVFRLSDRVAVVENGSVTTIGTTKEVFSSPRTVGGAVLTGCKFLSRAKMISPNRIDALDWGITITVAPVSHPITSVGIRMHDVRPGMGENSFLCQVAEEIEEAFSYTLLLRPVGQSTAVPFGYTISKEAWERQRTSTVQVHIPSDAILLLED